MKSCNLKPPSVCQFCRFPTIVKGLGRPMPICNRKKGAEGIFYPIQTGNTCPNFAKTDTPPILIAVPGLSTEADIYNIRIIYLTQGKIAIIGAEKYPILSPHKWHATKGGRTWYAMRRHNNKQIWMHRVITNAPDGFVVDHINHNGLDNRKSNLRICTTAQNAQNKRPPKDSSSKYKGVYHDKCNNRFESKIRIDGKNLRIGRFKNEIEAAKAYDAKAKELFGEYAYLNFPMSE